MYVTLFGVQDMIYQRPHALQEALICFTLLYFLFQAQLTQQQNQFTITLKELEDSLLSRLSAAGGNFLGDYALVENLETTKRTAAEIEVKAKEAKLTEIKINEAREAYRPAAARASLLYFILNDLNKINPIYQFSLKVKYLPFSFIRNLKIRLGKCIWKWHQSLRLLFYYVLVCVSDLNFNCLIAGKFALKFIISDSEV